MASKLCISALIIITCSEMVVAQTAPASGFMEPSLDGLSACQSLHNIPTTLSNLQNRDATASAVIYEAEAEKLFQHIQILQSVTKTAHNAEGHVNADIEVLSNTLTELTARLETSPSTRGSLDGAIPADFTQTLRSVSTQLDCGQYMFEPPTPTQGQSKSKSPLGSANRTSTTSQATPVEISEIPTYNQFEDQGLGGNASARHLARNPVKFLFDSNGRYLFLLSLLMVISGLIYLYRRFKKFEAREPRRLLSCTVKIKIEDEIYDFRLVDLSRNGAKLNHGEIIRANGNIHLELGGHWYLGQIKWHNNFFAGIKFKTPLDAHTFGEITRTS